MAQNNSLNQKYLRMSKKNLKKISKNLKKISKNFKKTLFPKGKSFGLRNYFAPLRQSE
jgi:preprotein translocase subunit SecE